MAQVYKEFFFSKSRLTFWWFWVKEPRLSETKQRKCAISIVERVRREKYNHHYTHGTWWYIATFERIRVDGRCRWSALGIIASVPLYPPLRSVASQAPENPLWGEPTCMCTTYTTIYIYIYICFYNVQLFHLEWTTPCTLSDRRQIKYIPGTW